MVRPRGEIKWARQDHLKGHCTRREKERKTEKEVGGQRQSVDGPDLRQLAASSRGQRALEEDCPRVTSGASKTPFLGLGRRRERSQLAVSGSRSTCILATIDKKAHQLYICIFPKKLFLSRQNPRAAHRYYILTILLRD